MWDYESLRVLFFVNTLTNSRKLVSIAQNACIICDCHPFVGILSTNNGPRNVLICLFPDHPFPFPVFLGCLVRRLGPLWILKGFSLLYFAVPPGVIQNGSRMLNRGMYPGVRPLPINPICMAAAVRYATHRSAHDFLQD